jgi:hypothetical protein
MKINKNFNEQINNDRQTLRKRYLEAFPERIQSDNNINILNNNTSLPNPKKKGYYKRNNITAEPFVYKEIGETSLINSRIIPAQSTIDDAVRLGKFAISTKGIIFAAKQTALQAINNYN